MGAPRRRRLRRGDSTHVVSAASPRRSRRTRSPSCSSSSSCAACAARRSARRRGECGAAANALGPLACAPARLPGSPAHACGKRHGVRRSRCRRAVFSLPHGISLWFGATPPAAAPREKPGGEALPGRAASRAPVTADGAGAQAGRGVALESRAQGCPLCAGCGPAWRTLAAPSWRAARGGHATGDYQQPSPSHEGVAQTQAEPHSATSRSTLDSPSGVWSSSPASGLIVLASIGGRICPAKQGVQERPRRRRRAQRSSSALRRKKRSRIPS